MSILWLPWMMVVGTCVPGKGYDNYTARDYAQLVGQVLTLAEQSVYAWGLPESQLRPQHKECEMYYQAIVFISCTF
jgi:hypothetical protein